ncbi:MAG: CHAP domain-containing protein [Gemmatimonadota bacterium]|nr:CHAP domain-containing protein [Gemmatimonadota bacterium]
MRVLDVARGYLAVREAPRGSNRSPEIDRWLRAVGAPLASPWCAAFVYDCLIEAGLTPPKKSGRVQDWVDATAEPNRRPAAEAVAGDVLVFYFRSLKRYAHIGLVTGRDAGAITTIEGNTIATDDKGDSRAGYGVFEHRFLPSPNLLVLRLAA